MATVNKDFKVKNGLIVEGTTGTINNYDILTKNEDDQDYIVGLIGGTATSSNTPDSVVKRDGSGNFSAGTITASLTGNASTASTLATARNIELTGDVTGYVAFDGSQNVQISTTIDGDFATDSELQDHINDTSTHGVTGNIVGTTDTQTLTNKTIESGTFTKKQTFTADTTGSNPSATFQIPTGNTGSKTIDILGTAGQSIAYIGNGGSIRTTNWVTAGTTTNAGQLTVTGNAGVSTGVGTTYPIVYVKGIASQTNDMLQINNNSGTKVMNVDKDGNINTATGNTYQINGTTVLSSTEVLGKAVPSGTIVGTTDSQTLSNKTLGTDLAAGGYKVSGLATPTANADAATKSYVDGAISNLVDGAPALLDTLNELAAAINDDAGFSSTITTSIGNKVAKAGDSMTGNLDFGGTNKVTSLAAPTSNGDAANKLYVDDAASTAESNANDYTDTELTSYTPTASLDTTIDGYGYLKSADLAGYATESYADTAAGTAESNANDYTDNAIGALTTSDIEEGSNQYFTDNRAKDAAGYILENASQTNISITYDETNHTLSVTAENGVADSDTDDLDEGSTNLYFTDARAVSALEAVTPNLPAVEINNIAKQVAASAAVATASTVNAYTWAKADYRSAKFLVKFETASHSEISEVLITLDGSDNVAITEYAIVGTNGNLGNVTADVSGSDVRLRVTTINNSTDVMVMGTLLV